MPFSQHLDRTARVAGEESLPVASMLDSLQKNTAPLALHTAIQASTQAVVTKFPTDRAHAELPHAHSEPQRGTG